MPWRSRFGDYLEFGSVGQLLPAVLLEQILV
jgi:hypothetical protein